jgi:hypothetical protein
VNNHSSKNIHTFAPQTLYLMIKNFLRPVLVLLPVLCMSQEPENPYKFSLSGYVRADAIFDSRQAVEAREGYLLFYPKKPVFDKQGKDINAQPSFNQYAMTTRLTGKITGPDIMGAKAFALIESDFTGASNSENNSLRLRHAYISMQWKTTRLMAGQYWHPQDIPEMIPNVLALNTGAPFHSFSRQPQVRVDQKIGKFNLVAVAASQRDYVNTGPGGNSPSYLRNSVIPNLHAQLQFKQDKAFAGASIDYKNLTPRLVTDSAYISNESVNCMSYSAFGSLKFNHLIMKTQYTLNRALNDHLMMGGFAVTDMDATNGRFEYMPLSYHSAWINLTYNKTRWQPSFFAGYTINATDEDEIKGAVYARDPDIDYVYRIAPMLTYTEKKFSFHCEFEYTVAAFEYDKTSLILLKSYETALLRVNVAAVYSF